MPRKIKSNALGTRSARATLPVRAKPFYQTVAAGVGLGYRRNKRGAGVWVVRGADGQGGNWIKAFADADDHEDANGETILTFDQAASRARALARGENGESTGPATWAAAIDAYERDLAARGARPRNAACLRGLVPAALLARPVAMLNAKELRAWRDGLLGRMTPASVTRYCKCACASLAFAARLDRRIDNAREWREGLRAIADSRRARNEVLTDAQVRAIVADAYERGAPGVGLFVEMLAVTGSRPIQVARLVVGDLQATGVMMPRSKKGAGIKTVARRYLPLPAGLIAKLRAEAQGRRADDDLLRRPDGKSWEAAGNAKIGYYWAKAELPSFPYALRHSSITRALVANVPARLVADAHDTSVREIEATYGKHISDHGEHLLRGALIDLEPNVITLRGRA